MSPGLPWTAVAYVSSGVTLVAFLAATVAWVLRLAVLRHERLILAAPEDSRAELVIRTLEVFQVDTRRLTKEHQYELALRQIIERARRFRTIAIVIIVAAILAAALSLAAIFNIRPQTRSDAASGFSETIVPHPNSPREWYGNARFYELRGDTLNAVKSYQGYAESASVANGDYLDPVKDYVALLTATEGIVRTRQLIAELRDVHPDSRSLELVSVTLIDSPKDRLEQLVGVSRQHPTYGPAFNELGKEYDRALREAATADLAAKQAAAYGTLIKLEEQQAFSRYYLDKSAAESALADARRMMEAYANARKVWSEIEVTIYSYPDGTTFVVALSEGSARQLLFGIDDPDPKRDSGKIGIGAQTFINMSIGPIPLPVGKHTFYFRYVDQRGVMSKTRRKDFLIDPVSIMFTQQVHDTSDNTASGSFFVGVTGAKDSSALQTFEYGLDSRSLAQKLVAPAAGGMIQVKGLAAGAHKLYIETAGSDGIRTPLVEYPFSVR